MTPIDIDALERLLEAATPRPWKLFGNVRGKLVCIYHRHVDDIIHWAGFDATSGSWAKRKRDAALIVALVNAAPALIAAYRAQQAAEAALTAERTRREGLEAELLKIKSAEPDMFWDAEDPEYGGRDEYEIISNYAVGEIVRLQTAFSGPDMWGVRYEVPDGDDEYIVEKSAEEVEAKFAALTPPSDGGA